MAPDRSRLRQPCGNITGMKTTRRILQLGFLILTLVGVFVIRGNPEAWCPFGGVEAAYGYLKEGNLLCSLGVSNFYILAAVLIIALLVRRAFCGYLCPIGTLSEWLQRGVARLGLRAAKVPYRLDRGLALLKYAVLAVILFFTYRTAELAFRGYDPCYALLSRNGEDITVWAYIVSGAIAAGSLLVIMPFCRWLCPLAAVFHPFSRFGLARIKRDESACISCGECAAACPMAIPVDKERQVTAARCLSCFNCLEACPSQAEGAIVWGPPGTTKRRWPQAVLVAIILATVSAAIAATYAFPLPSFVQTRPLPAGAGPPAQTQTIEFRVEGLTCRGKANLFWWFLERDDDLAIPGYLKLEAWPGPGGARAIISYDPDRTDAASIQEAILGSCYDQAGGYWRASPFRVVGDQPGAGTSE